ncbi:hypothetical protein Vretimale_3218 [Volvox reticuliferus]|uniref:Uncharacterized protein n=1 Tax=Volvox reticuliferus TaxID=1737510 RepID=A0A8J4FMM7_9CHLO|nr:hypothetical protein Vretifemale_6615 [Volvox reticuliferus]GIL97638.1 hypothetical protein Vretimale_3218 [Volvox reticuliferus]
MYGLRFPRALLHSSNAGEELDQLDYPGKSTHDDTEPLRVVSIFVILATGLLGGLPPLFLKVFRDPDSVLTHTVRSFAAGVIAALALVHIIPEAVQEMTDLGGIEYPLGGTCALAGIALMILLEHVAHIMHNGENNVVRVGAGGTAAAAVAAVAADTVSDCTLKVPPSCSSDLQNKDSGIATGVTALQPHAHGCVSRGSATNWISAGALEAMGSLRLKVIAYLFELGCIFHSFIIGLSLGVNQTDIKEVRSLLIALAFHQWLEGISLASVVTRGGFSALKGGLMILTYSLTCPVGIAVGMAIAETYDAESTKSRGIQGAFNGVSGGMLLYISLVQLVAEDMGRLVPGRDSAMGRMACFAALCGGAASMCLLAVWA